MVTKQNGATLEMELDDTFGPGASQKEVYQRMIQDPVGRVTQGYNATVFAYGQTGTGKTYTMLGDDFTVADDAQAARGGEGGGFGVISEGTGMIQRAALDLFSFVEGKEEQGLEVRLTCSYMEIYNEKLHDLLEPYKANPTTMSHDPHMIHCKKAGLEIRDDGHEVFVAGLTEVEVPSLSTLMSVIEKGNRHREVRGTEMNQGSSRSHSILQISLKQQVRPNSHSFSTSKLNLVDLAGSERFPEQEVGSDRISELTSINSSLSALATVVASLTDRHKTHIPYRDSKLTHILQDSLGGNCSTTFIVTVSPSEMSAEESISTLKFADRARNIQNSAVVNIQSDPGAVARMKDDEIQRLKDLLQMFVSQEGSDISTLSALTDKLQKAERENLKLRLELKSLREEVKLERQARVRGEFALKGKRESKSSDPIMDKIDSLMKKPGKPSYMFDKGGRSPGRLKDRKAEVAPASQTENSFFSLQKLHSDWHLPDEEDLAAAWEDGAGAGAVALDPPTPDKESTPVEAPKKWGRSSLGAPKAGGWGRSSLLKDAGVDLGVDLPADIENRLAKPAGPTFDKGSLIYILGRQSSSLNAAKAMKVLEREAWGREALVKKQLQTNR